MLDAAGALCEHLAQHFSSLLGKEFYSGLAAIAWVPATTGLPGSARATPVVCFIAEPTFCWAMVALQLPA